MKKKWMTMLIAGIMIVYLLSSLGQVIVRAEKADEETVKEYIPIYTKEDLNDIRNDTNSDYYLANDIIFENADFEEGGEFYNQGEKWIPINLSGNFDGNGYCIYNLQINSTNITRVGLFSSAETVTNLGLENCNIQVESVSNNTIYVGAICASLTSVKNCYTTGNINVSTNGDIYVGGIAGRVQNIIMSCNYTEIKARGRGYNVFVGGLAGYIYEGSSNGCIKNCYNAGKVTGSNALVPAERIGGLCGCMDFGYVENSYSVGTPSICGLSLDGVFKNVYCLNPEGADSDNNNNFAKYYKEMINEATYQGFDFESVWISGNDDYPFPLLRNIGFINVDVSYTKPHIKQIFLSNDTYEYGENLEKITVKDTDGDLLTEGVDYVVEYPQHIGEAMVKIEGTGDYQGSYFVDVVVNPPATSISSVTAGECAFIVKWLDVFEIENILGPPFINGGYQVKYSSDDSFDSYKTVTIENVDDNISNRIDDTIMTRIEELKAGRKYYVKVRTYTTDGDTKYYSSWSEVTSVRTKPMSTNITSITTGGRNFTVKWKKVSNQVTGYQIYYATQKDFSNAKKFYIKNKSTKSKTIENLAAGKKYYVKIRTYKEECGEKYYSKWSVIKSVRPKPISTNITNVKAGEKSFTVKWNKRIVQVTGYQIRYSTSSSMSNSKTKTITNNTTTNKKITGLKAKKKYFIQLRTYRTLNGKKYYSDWSTKKNVKTK